LSKTIKIVLVIKIIFDCYRSHRIKLFLSIFPMLA
jgi:hypothetical protein